MNPQSLAAIEEALAAQEKGLSDAFARASRDQRIMITRSDLDAIDIACDAMSRICRPLPANCIRC